LSAVAIYSCKTPAIWIDCNPHNFRDATMSANAPIILVVEDDDIVRMLIVDAGGA
jgi:hypothetical protein